MRVGGVDVVLLAPDERRALDYARTVLLAMPDEGPDVGLRRHALYVLGRIVNVGPCLACGRIAPCSHR
jgi:hypothetical protein